MKIYDNYKNYKECSWFALIFYLCSIICSFLPFGSNIELIFSTVIYVIVSKKCSFKILKYKMHYMYM